MIMPTVLAGAVMGLLGFAAWWILLRQSVDEAQARNLLFLFFVLCQSYHVFNCRSEHESAFRVPLRRNPVLMAGAAIALGLHLLAMQWSFTQELLRIAPVSLHQFLTMLLIASSVLWVMEIFKWVQRRRTPATPLAQHVRA
jgi:magnesium-transporting ATPase (P-type)